MTRGWLQFRPLVATLLVLLCGTGMAQGWSVQTVALRDLRQGKAVVAQLQALGFDAYNEFAMHDGEQFVRVRVGCYTDKAAAQAAADALAGHVTKKAVPVKLASDSRASGCLQEDIGFLKPSVWKPLDTGGGAPAFRVEVGGHKATLVYRSSGWRLLQAGDPASPASAPADAHFTVAHPGGVAWVVQQTSNGPRMLCPGKLLGTASSAAIVERANEVVACRLVPLARELAGGGGP